MSNSLKNVKLMAIAVALFISPLAFTLIMVSDGTITDDPDRLLVYMVLFFTVFLLLNVLLVAVIVRTKKLKIGINKCISCSAVMNADAEVCPKCRATQPATPDRNMHLCPGTKDDNGR